MVQNPLKSHIPDSVFEFLIKHNLLNEKGVRDFQIRQRFNVLRKRHTTQRSIELLQEEYAYLTYETIRKIIYQKVKLHSPEYFYLF